MCLDSPHSAVSTGHWPVLMCVTIGVLRGKDGWLLVVKDTCKSRPDSDDVLSLFAMHRCSIIVTDQNIPGGLQLGTEPAVM